MPVTINIEIEGTEEEIADFLTKVTGHPHTARPKPEVTRPDHRLAEANPTYPTRALPPPKTPEAVAQKATPN